MAFSLLNLIKIKQSLKFSSSVAQAMFQVLASWPVAAVLARVQSVSTFWAALLGDEAVLVNEERNGTCIIQINQLHLTTNISKPCVRPKDD